MSLKEGKYNIISNQQALIVRVLFAYPIKIIS